MMDYCRSPVSGWRRPTPARFMLLLALSAFGCSGSSTSNGGGAGTGSGTAGAMSVGGALGASGAASSGAPGTAGSPSTGTAGAFSAGGSTSGTAGSSSGGSSAGGASAGGASAGGASGGSTSHGGSAGMSSATGGSGGGTMPGTVIKSPGCGKTSTITFGAIPGEDASATPGGPKNGTGKGGYVNIMSGGARGFAMRLPDGYDNNKPYPLFFAFHWNGGNSKDQDTGGDNGYFTAYYGIQRKSNNGMFFVAPDSIGAGWNNAG